MARLFISLYVFIALSLVGLSATLEWAFFKQSDAQTDSFFENTLKAANLEGVNLEQFVDTLQLPNRSLPINDLAWSKADRDKLQAGEALRLNDPSDGEQLYIMHGEGLVLEVSIPQQAQDASGYLAYSIIFFLLLGAVIALWIWPLWRDLSSLEKTVSHILPDGSIRQNTINKTSLIYPIAKSLNQMREQISLLMQSQRELSGAVAHEFRTPLARLKFALAMAPTAKSGQWIEMQQDVNELELLVQEMLDYASTNAQIPEINLSEIPIKQLCEQLITRLKRTHFIELEVVIEGEDLLVLADEHFIERAIENLLLNAVRYAKSNIEVHIRQSAKIIEINVEDDGAGVAKDMREKIFTPFYRPDESRNRQQGGAGLGLAIVKKIIEWHQGNCFVTDSNLGGAKFVIQLTNKLEQIS